LVVFEVLQRKPFDRVVLHYDKMLDEDLRYLVITSSVALVSQVPQYAKIQLGSNILRDQDIC